MAHFTRGLLVKWPKIPVTDIDQMLVFVNRPFTFPFWNRPFWSWGLSRDLATAKMTHSKRKA